MIANDNFSLLFLLYYYFFLSLFFICTLHTCVIEGRHNTGWFWETRAGISWAHVLKRCYAARHMLVTQCWCVSYEFLASTLLFFWLDRRISISFTKTCQSIYEDVTKGSCFPKFSLSSEFKFSDYFGRFASS